MTTTHEPVLVKEVINCLNPKANQNFIDCTVGGGGHAEAILNLTGPAGKLLGLDWDGAAIARASERLRPFGGRAELARASYTQLKQIVYDKKFLPISGVLLDLGLSSDQLKDSGRGFSFQVNEPLDMRYCPEENDVTAARILNEWPEEKLIEILKNNADERQAKKIARAIADYRQKKRFATTLELVSLIMRIAAPRKGKIHPATKTFQALRMTINNEIENISSVLKDIVEILPSTGRIAVITFHSVEDRLVKEFFKQESSGCLCPPEIPVCRCQHQKKIKIINKKAIAPTAAEIERNFRSRSAKLRAAEKL
ncbi:16S rRNA (cytosine(1402)-N(4))-methyltransferase RsmH [Candidatus Falkowbacteria bacterium]|nr:16S rRNA (cytosine(1402)-N(4))-methyltransferase RsmH [Candidatus Falkowbacteria bacterium]